MIHLTGMCLMVVEMKIWLKHKLLLTVLMIPLAGMCLMVVYM